MKFRDKLILLISAVVITSVLLSAALFDNSAKEMVLAQSRAKALSIAASAAAVIDGDLHKGILSRADEESPAYRKISNDLLRIRNANRREDTVVQQIYTIYPSDKDPKVFFIGVDPSQEPEFSSHAGDVLHLRNTKTPDITKAYAPEEYFEDQFGTWSAAFAPIHDSSGRAVGAVVVEIPKTNLTQRLATLHLGALYALGCGVLLALAGSLLIARVASKPLDIIKDGLAKIQSGDFAIRLTRKSKDEFGEVASAFNNMAGGLQERETVKSAFARYVSQQVLDSVISSGQAPIVSGDRRKVTALCADIRGFTSLAEKLPPEKVVKLLNEYFDGMVDIIFKHKGTLDKFIGDGIMVIFGAPEDDPFQEENAIRAALEMQQSLKQLRDKWAGDKIEIRIGIGINSGNAIVGNIGSSRRMEYTAIGDSVNLAARLESATKDVGVDILISDYTHHAVRGVFSTVKVGSLSVKGREEPVMTYTIV